MSIKTSKTEPLPVPLAGIAKLAGQHAELGTVITAAEEEAASLRVVAELQERLAAFDAQVDAGGRLHLHHLRLVHDSLHRVHSSLQMSMPRSLQQTRAIGAVLQ